MPFAVSVKDRMMYSHTFVFEDGQPFTTGCTSVATVTIEGSTLGPYDILIDICLAQQLLKDAVAAYDHKNLDTLPEFARDDGTRMNTTVEIMARAIFRRMFQSLSTHHKEHSEREGKGLGAITALRVMLEESDVASASYWESKAEGLFC